MVFCFLYYLQVTHRIVQHQSFIVMEKQKVASLPYMQDAQRCLRAVTMIRPHLPQNVSE